jgi:beta-galactosidase
VVKNTPYCSGQFIWTGWDYIGEPTPYTFPSRSSYFGIIDLAGFPKDVYYMYKSEWTHDPVLHLFPHWNWIPGQEIDMWCYYSGADEVELFVNGESQGVRSKGEHDYHVSWRVVYEPGQVEAVARRGGEVVGRQVIKTAGAPSEMRLSVDYAGDELTVVNVEVTDSEGNLCPWAENQIFFSTGSEAGSDGSEAGSAGLESDAAGSGSDAPAIVGVDNGSEFSMEKFKDNKRKAFFGKCMVVLRGHGTLTATAYDLSPATIEF